MLFYSPLLDRRRVALLRAAAVRHPPVPGHRRTGLHRGPRARRRPARRGVRVRRRRRDDPGLRRRGAHRRTASTPPSRRTALPPSGRRCARCVAFSSGQLVAGLTLAVVLVVGTDPGRARQPHPRPAARLPLPRQPLHPAGAAGHRDPQRAAERRRRLAPRHRRRSTPRPTSPTPATAAWCCRVGRSPCDFERRLVRLPRWRAPSCTTSTSRSRPQLAGGHRRARPARASPRSPSC